tara:strand:+ start:269 stop:1114 length:846 start_codon:yes stop_codon:yes gene_type:complete
MIIWVASYPKSGNTWIRSIISSLIYSKEGIFDFSYIKQIKQFPQKLFFEEFTKDYNDIHEIKKYWVLAQEKLNLDNKIKFLKTHHLNCKVDDYTFTNRQCTQATIYIVRDPRNLIESISNHFTKSEEESLEFLLSSRIIAAKKNNIELEGGNIITYIGSWRENYYSWTKNNENLLVIKYEDLLDNTFKEMDKIISFLKKFVNFDISEKKKKNIINTTSFDYLKKLENSGNFNENVYIKGTNKKAQFFNKGPSNIWKNQLKKEVQLKLEKELEKELVELGYL